MLFANDYVFTGTTGTFTLPQLHAYYIGSTYRITVKNRGASNLTIASYSGGNDIYTTSAVSSMTLIPGQAAVFISDGTYFNHE